QHARKPELAPGGGREVGPADDERHPLLHVVDRDGELVCPVPVTVSDQEITALRAGLLLEAAKQQVVRALDAGVDPDAEPVPGSLRQRPVPARPAIHRAAHPAPGAVARVYVMPAPEDSQRTFV